MKRLAFFSFAVLTLALLNSCEETSFDLDIPIEYTITKNVEIPGNVSASEITDTNFFDADVDPDLKKNLDKVSSLEVEQILIDISNLNIIDSLAFVKAKAEASLRKEDPISEVVFIHPLLNSNNEFTTLEEIENTKPIVISGADINVNGISDVLEDLKSGKGAYFITTYTGENQTSKTYTFDAVITIKFKAVATIEE
ncbi:MAG: hypothetical protein ACPF8V_06475 [Luteibaculum sp.]